MTVQMVTMVRGQLSMSLQMELLVNNDQRVLPAVEAFACEALRQSTLEPKQIDGLVQLISRSTQAAIDRAYPVGEEGPIKVRIAESHGKLTMTVRDHGMPQDIGELQRQLHDEGQVSLRLFGIPCADLADDIHWIGYGPGGKALQITKWLHNTHITGHLAEADLKSFHEDVPLARDQQYTIRPMAVGEAVQVSQLMYRAYGGTYFNRDIYYPERVAAQHERGSVLSFVAAGEDGRLVGHYALERSQDGPVAEGGQAVVDPAHRGRGLLIRMKDAAVNAARQMKLVGLYFDAVAVHTLTQKSNVDHGAHLTCVNLGISPRGEQFRGIAQRQPQRVTCLQYFSWLQEPEPRTLYVPAEYQEVIEQIYQGLACPVTFGDAVVPQGHGRLTVKIDARGRTAFLRADELGEDSVHEVRRAKRELTEHSHAQAVFVELPLYDPGMPPIAIQLQEHGFSFAGIAPHFSRRGDLLRLVYLTEPLERDPIKTYGDFAATLVDFAVAQQGRLTTALSP